MIYGLFRMTPLWIYQQRRSGLGGHKLCYHTCRRWVCRWRGVCVVEGGYVSLKGGMCRWRGVCVVEGGYVLLKGGMCCWRGVYVAVVAVTTRRHPLHRYPLLWGLKSLVGSMKFVSWVKGKKMEKMGHNICCGAFSWRTSWWAPVLPRVFPSPITPSSENDWWASLSSRSFFFAWVQAWRWVFRCSRSADPFQRLGRTPLRSIASSSSATLSSSSRALENSKCEYLVKWRSLNFVRKIPCYRFANFLSNWCNIVCARVTTFDKIWMVWRQFPACAIHFWQEFIKWR